MSDFRIGRRQFGALAAGVALALGSRGWAAASEDARLDDFFESVFQRNLARSPVRQSRMGLKRDQDKWDGIGEAHRIESADLLRDDLAVLRNFDRARLSPQSDLSWRLFERQAEEGLKGFEWRRNDYLVTQMGGMHTRAPRTLMNSHPIDARADAVAYIARLHGVLPLMEQLVEELKRQEAAGVKPPRFAYALTIGPCENVLRGRPFDDSDSDSPLFADFKKKLGKTGWPEAEQAELMAEATAALRGPFARGYRGLIAHLREAESTATVDAGVWKLPHGGEYYDSLLQAYTTLPLTSGELHELGLSEVAAIHDDMRKIMRKVGFDGDLQAFFKHVRTDPRFYYDDTGAGRAAYIADAKALLDEVRSRQGEIFGVLPNAEVVVRAVEEWRAKSAPKAFYQSPPIGGSEPGIFYVNLYDVGAQPGYQLPAILFHEAIPGHHIETVIAHELDDVPKFRRFAHVAAFSEGWGLYSERLAGEMGLYETPYDDFGRLSMQLMRATRLVVDTGIHAKRWTREQAVSYLDRNMPGSHYDNQREIDRYIVLPGQATSYYVGMMKIVELRERARARLGARFDLRAFHDLVLGDGPLPLPVLEDAVDDWIDGRPAA